MTQADIRHVYFASGQMLKFRLQMTGVDVQFKRFRKRQI